MSEATSADIVRIAREMSDSQGRVSIGMLKGRFGNMPNKQWIELLEIALKRDLILLSDTTLVLVSTGPTGGEHAAS